MIKFDKLLFKAINVKSDIAKIVICFTLCLLILIIDFRKAIERLFK